MISIPLMPEEPYTAKSLADMLGSTIVIKLDATTQSFVGYTVAEGDDGFAIDGGRGYIVNTPAGGVVTFTGSAWSNPKGEEPAEEPAEENRPKSLLKNLLQKSLSSPRNLLLRNLLQKSRLSPRNLLQKSLSSPRNLLPRNLLRKNPPPRNRLLRKNQQLIPRQTSLLLPRNLLLRNLLQKNLLRKPQAKMLLKRKNPPQKRTVGKRLLKHPRKSLLPLHPHSPPIRARGRSSSLATCREWSRVHLTPSSQRTCAPVLSHVSASAVM